MNSACIGEGWRNLWVPPLADNCRPVRVLGHGGRSTVIEAQDDRHGRVAVKLPYAPGAPCDTHVLQKILKHEGTILAKIVHQQIVGLIEAPACGEYLMIELLCPRTLQEFRRSEEWQPRFAIRFVSLCAAALHELHRVGFLHLDFKPRNVLFRNERYGIDPVLADLGSGRPVMKPVGPGTVEKTMLGSGKYLFKAPEQLFGRVSFFGVETDAFALGATLYWLLTGVPAFSNRGSSGAEVRSRYDLEFGLVTETLSGMRLPGELIDLTRSLLAIEPRERERDLGKVAATLSAMAEAPQMS